jgi:hypothetical protein
MGAKHHWDDPLRAFRRPNRGNTYASHFALVRPIISHRPAPKGAKSCTLVTSFLR